MEIEEFLGYWRVIRKRLWLIVLLFVATVGVILVTTLTAPPVYSTSIKLQVIGSEPQQVSLFSTVRSASVSDEIAGVQAEFTSVLRNGLVAWRTISNLNLSMSAVELLNLLSVSLDGDTISVTTEASTPQEAEAIVNAHVENALSYYRDYRALPARVTWQFLSQQVETEGDVLSQAQDALLKFKLQNNVESLEKEMLAYQDIIRSLETQRDAEQVEALRSSILADSYTAQATKLQTELNQVGETATATQAYLRESVQRLSQMAREASVTAEGHSAAKDEFDRLKVQKQAELLALIGLSEDYSKLQQAVNLAQDNYNFLLSKENEAKLKESTAMGVGYIQIIEPARTPDTPAQSNLPRLLILGAVASIMAGIILAFVLEFVENLGRSVAGRSGVR